MTHFPSILNLTSLIANNIKALLQDTNDVITADGTGASEIRHHATQRGNATLPCTGHSSAVTMQTVLNTYVTPAVTLA